MSSAADALRPFAGHPVVASVAAVWTDLPRVLLLNAVLVLAAVPAWSAVAVGSPLGAIVAGWLLLGPAWVLVLRAVADATTVGIRLPGWRRILQGQVIRDGLALAAPAALALGCTLAAVSMGRSGSATAMIRGAALVVDLAVVGTVGVLLPAASAAVARGAHVDRRLWSAAARTAGSRPLLVLEALALAVLSGLLAAVGGRVALLPTLLLAPTLLATVLCALWPRQS